MRLFAVGISQRIEQTLLADLREETAQSQDRPGQRIDCHRTGKLRSIHRSSHRNANRVICDGNAICRRVNELRPHWRRSRPSPGGACRETVNNTNLGLNPLEGVGSIASEHEMPM